MPTVAHLGKRIFLILLAFRWASLLPALWLFVRGDAGGGMALAVALANTLLVTRFHAQLNARLLRAPWLLGLDLLFVAALLAFTGGAASPYILFALSPLLAGAFFFQLRGALAAAAVFTPLYFLALGLAQDHGTPPAPALVILQLAGIWLVTLLFSFPALLLDQLRHAHDELGAARDDLAHQNQELSTTHRQLKIVHDLTLLLQAAPDILSVQERVLAVVTSELGFPRAVLGLVDPSLGLVGGWRMSPPGAGKTPASVLSLDSRGDPLLQGLREEPHDAAARRWHTPGQFLTSEPALAHWLGDESWLIIPLWLREHPVGVLLVGADGAETLPWSEEQTGVLTMVAAQAAVSLGTTILCIDRARRLAIEQERNRIARDIHDSVSQSLFGIIYTLDACLQMLPEQAETVKAEIGELRDLASTTRDQVRRSIFNLWPSELTFERFSGDLQSFVNQCCGPRTFRVDFTVAGDFDGLSPVLRRTLYRVAQEALNNAAHHAGVAAAAVALHISAQDVTLEVRDEGVGFDPDRVLARAFNREHFGLHGMQERAAALGGECQIHSRPGVGTQIIIRLPLQPQGAFRPDEARPLSGGAAVF